jgi:DNA-binding response OmpR family regulator
MPCATIMIVDDELDLVRALTLRFTSAGYDVIHATDGVVATGTRWPTACGRT